MHEDCYKILKNSEGIGNKKYSTVGTWSYITSHQSNLFPKDYLNLVPIKIFDQVS